MSGKGRFGIFMGGSAAYQYPRDGLVGEWLFEGDANDTSGRNNHGTPLLGTSLTTDRNGIPDQAYLMDGGNDYISVTTNSGLGMTSEISLVAWVRPTHIFGIDKFISSSSNYWDLFYNADKVAFNIVVDGSPTSIIDVDNSSNNTWYLVVGTYDGANLRIYVNGIQKNSTPLTGTINENTGGVKFGAKFSGGSGQNFTGKEDDILIYDRALTPSEILTMYNGTKP